VYNKRQTTKDKKEATKGNIGGEFYSTRPTYTCLHSGLRRGFRSRI